MKKIVTFLFILISASLQAQWKYANFPDGGQVMSLLQQNNTLFAGTPTGIFQSTDHANNWVPTYQVSLYNILCLVPNGNEVYAGTEQGVYKTTDNGISWTKLGTKGIDNYRIHAVAIKGTTIFAATIDGVFVSADNGNNWTPVNNNFPNTKSVYGLHVEGNNLLASTYLHLYVSTDEGKNWAQVDTGNTGNIIGYHFSKNKQALFTAGPKGLFSSTDQGNRWMKNSSIPIETIHSLTTKGDSVFVGFEKGVYASYNNGNSWELLNDKGLVDDSSINCIAYTNAGLFAGTRKGIYFFDSAGKMWIPKNKGLSNKGLASLRTVGSNLFAGTFEGTFLSVDSSRSWVQLRNGVPFQDVALNFGITANNHLFMSTSAHGMFLSTDGGKNWVAKNNRLPTDLRTVERINNKLYAGTLSSGLFESTDEGDNWSQVHTLFSNNLDVSAIVSEGNNIYLGTSLGFILSTDNGNTWFESNNGLNFEPFVIAVNKKRIFVGSIGEGVFVSDDTARTWKAVNGLPVDTYIFDMDANGNTVFAASPKDGIFASTDNGDHWKSIQDNLKNLQAAALAIQDDNLYLGIYGSGVWYRKLSEITPGIAENKDAAAFFKIFPNPSNGLFFIQASTAINRIEVMNPIGQLVYSLQANTPESPLDLSDQTKGIYIVRVISKDGNSASQKIIIH